MKYPAAVLLTLALAAGSFTLLGARPKASAPTRPKVAVAAVPDTGRVAHRIIAYYFHGDVRCVSCRKIEAYSREAIEQAFAGELKDGRLDWRVVNLDQEGNQHFTKDYQLFTKSLVLVDEVKGKQVRWKNLEKVWEHLQDKPAFFRYVQDETRAYLKDRT